MKYIWFLALLFAPTLWAADAPSLAMPAVTPSGVVLTWNLSTSTCVTSQTIYRSNSAAAPASFVTGISASAVTYKDSTVTPGSTYSYAVTATCPATSNPGGESVLSNIATITVPAAILPLTITSSAPPKGTVNTAYSSAITVTGGVSPYVYSASMLAPGLSINANTGAITGTPNAAGNYSESFTVLDSEVPPLQATAGYSIVVNAGAPPPPATGISINFVGTGTAMAATETAGVVPLAHWNNATNAAGTNLPLLDQTGTATQTTVTYTADNTWVLPGTYAAGNARLMSGYLDDKNGTATTVKVAGLPSANYDVIVYADGDNGTATRAGSYAITGGSAVTLTDAAKNFTGTFTQGTNYAQWSLTSITGFTITVTPGTASDGTKRAPLNGIQIIPTSAPPPPPPPPPSPTLSIDCPIAKAGLTQTNIPAATPFKITATSDGLTTSCTGSF